MSADDELDHFYTPLIEDDVASTGAAADSSDLDEQLAKLPRILRYAMLVSRLAENIEPRLIAEINELCPGLAQTAAWASARSMTQGLELAKVLDRAAVDQDRPLLRSLADCVRLLSMPLPHGKEWFDDHRRVGKALIEAGRATFRTVDEKLSAELEAMIYGWAALACCTEMLYKDLAAAKNAAMLGRAMAERRIEAVRFEFRRKQQADEEERARQEAEAHDDAEVTPDRRLDATRAAPENHIVVAQLPAEALKNSKLRELVGPVKHAINEALPLIEVPSLPAVRNRLLLEFPYAAGLIEFVLADLIGRKFCHLRPVIFLGNVGSGKSLFARRLGELLGLHVWRTDASRADGSTFGGTDRRWHTAEPCHPFLAIARGRQANPLVLIDEIEKAATRADHGRLWDTLLGFTEGETAARHPDPALQVDVNLAYVSYVATANSIDPLPGPIRDRFRVVQFPEPSAHHLESLLPTVLAGLARERGLDARWIKPLDGAEHEAVASHWRGGSVRRLRRVVEAVLRHREQNAARH